VTQVTLTSLAARGQAVGKEDGRVVFVDGGAPGDVAELEYTRVRKNHAEARIGRLVTPSAQRVTAPCPVFGACGGCQWQHVSEEAQRAAKRSFVVESLKRIGGIESPAVEATLTPVPPYGYRNRVIHPIEWREGRPVAGFYRRSSHELVEAPVCAVARPEIAPVVAAALQGLTRATGAGGESVRHLSVRVGERTGETLLTFVTGEAAFLGAEPFAADLVANVPGLAGVVHNRQPDAGNTVFGAESRAVAGLDHVRERIRDLTFRVSATAFFQVSAPGAEALAGAVLEFLSGPKASRVLDLFCGGGLFSLVAARAGATTLGVDSAAAAIHDARVSAEWNQLPDASFRCGDGEGLAEEALASFRPDAVVVDPPRQGLARSLAERLASCAASRLAYVSCDPATLARDLKILLAGGWRPVKITPVDLFPQTFHVETIALLSR